MGPHQDSVEGKENLPQCFLQDLKEKMQRQTDSEQKEGVVKAPWTRYGPAFLPLPPPLLLRETSPFLGSEIFWLLSAIPDILQSNTHRSQRQDLNFPSHSRAGGQGVIPSSKHATNWKWKSSVRRATKPSCGASTRGGGPRPPHAARSTGRRTERTGSLPSPQ